MAQKQRGHPRAVKQYKHLTVFERSIIGQKYKEGLHGDDIAKLIKRDRSTVIREIERNGAPKDHEEDDPETARAWPEWRRRSGRPA